MAAQAAAEEPGVPEGPRRASYNNFGITGLIENPTAEMQPDGQITVTTSFFSGFLRNTVSAQIFPGIEAAFRYAALADFFAPPGETTTYDRSFDIKARLVEEGPHWPSVAIGLQDFLGTGIYSGEYVVATKNFLGGDLSVTGGIGWGRFASLNEIANPFAQIFDGAGNRADTFSGAGGSVDFGDFFQGDDIGPIAGLEWRTPLDGLSVKLEYSNDNFERERFFNDFAPNFPVNMGLEYRPLDGVEIGAYFMYGSEVGVRISLTGNPFKPLSDVSIDEPPLPLTPRAPAPGADVTLATLGPVEAIPADAAPATRFKAAGLLSVEIEERIGSVRWATATVPGSADYVCPSETAAAIDAEFGVIDAVTYVHEDGRVLCTVALRPKGREAIRLASRTGATHPTDWYAEPANRQAAVEALVATLEPDRLGLYGIELHPTRVEVYIENGRFRAWPRAIGRTARALARVMPPSVETFEIVAVERSLPVTAVTLSRSELEDIVNRPGAVRASWLAARVSDPDPEGWRLAEDSIAEFPRLNWAINPTVPLNLFDPDSVVRADLAVVGEVGVEFLPGLSVNAAVQKRVVGNLDDITRPNDSVLPPVRSDIAQYLSEGDPGITRWTGDYVTKLDRGVYGRVSAGLLEQMFAGFSGEVLWKPAERSWGLGAELNLVRQRSFETRFGFQDFNQITGHASVYWDTGILGIFGQVDAGRYLAGDYGATISLKRRFANGWEIGGFATFTDVPFDEFGEGSFDKGFFLRIPLAWAVPYDTRSELRSTIRPLTRDGGQRLNIANRLYPIVEDVDRAALRSNWGGFWE